MDVFQHLTINLKMLKQVEEKPKASKDQMQKRIFSTLQEYVEIKELQEVTSEPQHFLAHLTRS